MTNQEGTNQEGRYCHSCGFPINDDRQQFCPNCKSVLMDEDVSTKTYQMALPMKWYKFLIYFGLIASAILSFISGLDGITGNFFNIYGFSAKEAYAQYDGLKQLMTGIGTVSILYALYQLATWFCLLKKMKIGPRLVVAMYAVNPAISMITEIVAANYIASQTGQTLTQSGLSISGIIIDIAVGIAVAYANKVYFDKRSALFTN